MQNIQKQEMYNLPEISFRFYEKLIVNCYRDRFLTKRLLKAYYQDLAGLRCLKDFYKQHAPHLLLEDEREEKMICFIFLESCIQDYFHDLPQTAENKVLMEQELARLKTLEAVHYKKETKKAKQRKKIRNKVEVEI